MIAFDATKTLNEIIATYSAVFIPLIVMQFVFLLGYIVHRIKRG